MGMLAGFVPLKHLMVILHVAPEPCHSYIIFDTMKLTIFKPIIFERSHHIAFPTNSRQFRNVKIYADQPTREIRKAVGTGAVQHL